MEPKIQLDPMTETALRSLHDIAVPPHVSWLPQTWGWAALAVLLGIAVLVFIMFQGFGDPARMIVGQTGDKKTLDNIRKDLYLDQPKWKQFFFYLNDINFAKNYTKKCT